MHRCLLLTLILILGLGIAGTVVAQAGNAIDPLVRVLQAKGVLTDSEARAITASGSPAEQRDRLAALLRDKGVISSAEFEAVRTFASSPEIKTITADYRTSAPPTSAEPQPTPPKVIAAVAPTRLLGIDVPKREGLIPDIKLGTGARLKLYGIFKTSIYRSCGRDPAGCCVSDLLREQPVVRSGREDNYQVGKDTGRFWDAGASNVHWVIVKDDQVANGISEALSHVEAEGVIVEGNSFLEFIKADLAIMCARSEGGKIKPSARRALSKIDFLYLSTLETTAVNARRQFEEYCAGLTFPVDLNSLPIVTRDDTRFLLSRIYKPENLLGHTVNPPDATLGNRKNARRPVSAATF